MHSTAIFSEQCMETHRGLGTTMRKKEQSHIVLSFTCGCSCSALHCVFQVSWCLNSTQFWLFHVVSTSLLFWCQLAGEIIHLHFTFPNLSVAHFAYICCKALYAPLNMWARMHCQIEPERRISTCLLWRPWWYKRAKQNRWGECN